MVDVFARVAGLLLALFALAVPSARAVDVTTVGAIPNDGLDDSDAINQALNDNTEVFLPAGRYLIDTAINVPEGRTLLGAGMVETEIALTEDVHALDVGAQDIEISSFSISRPFDSGTYCIFVPGRQNITIDRVWVRESRSDAPAIFVIDSSGCAVTNCVVTDYQLITEGDRGFLGIFGVGIRVSESTDCIVRGNWVQERTSFDIPVSPEPGQPDAFTYQAGAIEGSDSANCLFSCNVVIRAGDGIDVGGASSCTVEDNLVANIAQTGIKLVNGSSGIDVLGNWLDQCGLVGIWLTPGNHQLGIQDSVADSNVLNRIGQGLAAGQWDGTFDGTMSAGVHVDAGAESSGVSMNNTVTNNSFYNTESSAFSFVIRGGEFSATGTTASNNNAISGNPPPFQPSDCMGLDKDGDGIPDMQEGASDFDGDGIPNLLDQDSDSDNASDAEEAAHNTDPLNTDSDGDGISDGDEILFGSDPLNPDDAAELPASGALVAACLIALIAAFRRVVRCP